MPPQATVYAAKEVASPLPTPSLGLMLSSVWIGLQSTAQSFFGRSNRPAKTAAPTNERSVTPETVGTPAADPRVIRTTQDIIAAYGGTLAAAWQQHDWSDVVILISELRRCWQEGRQVFICGNGGSAANAVHLANDLLYGVDKLSGRGMRVTALPANAAVLTCLANDIAYAEIYAQQLTALAAAGDLLIVFSGSGNSQNIVRALERAKELGMTSVAVLGFSGGRALQLADHSVYFPVQDMQVSEDLQMMVGHMAAQTLARIGR